MNLRSSLPRPLVGIVIAIAGLQCDPFYVPSTRNPSLPCEERLGRLVDPVELACQLRPLVVGNVVDDVVNLTEVDRYPWGCLTRNRQPEVGTMIYCFGHQGTESPEIDTRSRPGTLVCTSAVRSCF